MRGVGSLLPGLRHRRRPAQDERSAADLINAVPEREFPYGRQPECGPDTAAFRRLGATFTPHPAPETRPIPVAEVPDEVTVLEKVLDGLQNLDWTALDAARDRESLAYAHTSGAPFHNALLKEQRSPLVSVAPDGDWARVAWRPPAAPVKRHGDAVARRVGDLDYPEISGFTAPGADDLYAKLLRSVSVITGTTGIWNWRPAPSAGGAL
jgi:hypothetical protein